MVRALGARRTRRWDKETLVAWWTRYTRLGAVGATTQPEEVEVTRTVTRDRSSARRRRRSRRTRRTRACPVAVVSIRTDAGVATGRLVEAGRPSNARAVWSGCRTLVDVLTQTADLLPPRRTLAAERTEGVGAHKPDATARPVVGTLINVNADVAVKLESRVAHAPILPCAHWYVDAHPVTTAVVRPNVARTTTLEAPVIRTDVEPSSRHTKVFLHALLFALCIYTRNKCDSE